MKRSVTLGPESQNNRSPVGAERPPESDFRRRILVLDFKVGEFVKDPFGVDFPRGIFGILGGMTFDPIAALQEILNAHGIPTNRRDQSVFDPESGLDVSIGVVRVRNHLDSTLLQLDVRATSPRLGGKQLIESFAGRGTDESDATMNAFRKFLHASLHVLLAVLVDREHGADQVEWESWSSEGNQWQICLGPVTLQGEPPNNLVCGGLLDRLKEALLPKLSPGLHWIRYFFIMEGHEINVSEALVDNLDFPEGRAVIDSMDWPDGKYAAREFLMMEMLA